MPQDCLYNSYQLQKILEEKKISREKLLEAIENADEDKTGLSIKLASTIKDEPKSADKNPYLIYSYVDYQLHRHDEKGNVRNDADRGQNANYFIVFNSGNVNIRNKIEYWTEVRNKLNVFAQNNMKIYAEHIPCLQHGKMCHCPPGNLKAEYQHPYYKFCIKVMQN